MFEYGFPKHWTTLKKLIFLSLFLDGSGEQIVWTTVSGTSPLTLANSMAEEIRSLTQFGKCEQPSGVWNTAITQYGKCVQDGTPTPDASVDIVCNNGTLKYSPNLLDPSTSNIVIGESVNTQGQATTATNNWRTDYIPVVGGKTYIFYGRRKSDDVIAAYCRMNFYKSDKTAITPRPSYTQDTPTVATAPSDAAYVRLSCAPYNSQNLVTRDTFDAFNWMFSEGAAEIPYTPYVVGGIYTDGTPEVLAVRGKNLFDATCITQTTVGGITINAPTEDGAITASGSTEIAYEQFIFMLKNPLPAGKYTVSLNNSPALGNGALVGFGLGGATVGDRGTGLKDTNNSKVITIPEGSTADRIVIRLNGDLSAWSMKIQVEAGEVTPSAYEPYVQPQTVNDVPMLLSVGDYADEAEIISGGQVHKVGIKVLTSADVRSFSNGCWFVDVPEKKKEKSLCLCTHYVYDSGSSSGISDGQFGCASTTRNFYFKNSNISDIDEAKTFVDDQFAAGTPIIVLYPLEEETTESITAYPQLCNKLYNTADVTAEVDDISVTFTTGTQTVPSPYSQLPIVCNNGELKWNGTTVVTDGTPQVLTVGGKNLADPSYMDASSYGTLTLYGVTVDRAKLLPVEVGKTYTLSVKGMSSGACYYYLYKITADGTKTPSYILVNQTTESKAVQGTATFTVGADEKYYVQFANTVSIQRITFEEFQLELGSPATAYEPYVAPQTVNDVSNLLAVGDVKDAEELIAGIKTGKVGAYCASGDSECYMPGENIFRIVLPNGKAADSLDGLCTHYKFNRGASTPAADKNFAIYKATYGGSPRCCFGVRDSSFSTLDAFKAMLDEKRPIILYPLATEQTEQGTAHALNSYDGTTIITADTNVDPVTLEVEYAASA